MESAGGSRKERAQDELDDILREATDTRRRGNEEIQEILGDREEPPSERRRQLKLVPGVASAPAAGNEIPTGGGRETKVEAKAAAPEIKFETKPGGVREIKFDANSAGAAREIKYEAEEFHLAEPSNVGTRPLVEVTPATTAAIVILALLAFLWIRFPGGLPIVPAPKPDPVYAEASVRWALVLTSQRIDRFQRDFYRTPYTLDEVGPPASELISYERISEDRYRLTAPGPNGPLVLGTEDSRAQFLGQSLKTLRVETKP